MSKAQLIDISQAAEILKISERTFRRRRAAGGPLVSLSPVTTESRNKMYFRKADVLELARKARGGKNKPGPKK